MSRLSVQVWSDIACPWYYVGKRRLEAAIARLPDPAEVEVVWRSFELDPSAPRVQPPGMSYAERLGRKYGTSIAQAQAMIDRMTSIAAADGLPFRFDLIQPGNTFDAHRLVHLAHARGMQDAVKERLLRAYLVEGEPIGDRGTLARLATDVGLDSGEVRDVLAGDGYADAVRADEHQARRLGIQGVPFFVLENAYGVSGAQPVEVLLAALTQARAEAPQSAVREGAVCGPDGCA